MTLREAILEQVRGLPALPAAAVNVLALMRDPNVDIDTVAAAISYDPGLTANLLRLANSTLYASNHDVASVAEAFVRLGTKNVMSLVVCSAVGPIAQAPVEGYELSRGVLWEHCVSVAIATEQFADVLGIRAPAAAFTAGLLCDIGKLALGSFVQGVGEAISDLAFNKGMSFECAEHQLLGLDHAEAGAALLERWQLPNDVVAAVRWHHEPELCPEQFQPIADLVHVADHACTSAGLGGGQDGTNYRLSSNSVSRTGLTQEHLELAMCHVACKLDELRDQLDLSP